VKLLVIRWIVCKRNLERENRADVKPTEEGDRDNLLRKHGCEVKSVTGMGASGASHCKGNGPAKGTKGARSLTKGDVLLNLGSALASANKFNIPPYHFDTQCYLMPTSKISGAKMLIIRTEQMDQMARGIFIGKLDAAFTRDVPGFVELGKDDRTEFFKQCILTAESRGLKTEQGIASYALAVWWLGLEFESASKELQALLDGDYPEVRKVHAMNEWVHAVTGDPDNIGAADEKLKQALAVTEAWGK
jgi:hypothetical protein